VRRAIAIVGFWKTYSRNLATACFRAEHPCEVELLAMSSYLIDYPFAGRLFPSALAVLERLRSFGPTVILSDGDVVFQPHKVKRAGLSDAVDGRVLIYIHKEEALDDVERRFPAEHYVIVDDKLRILAAVKRFWGDRVTTVFVRQGAPFRLPISQSNASAICSAAICSDRARRRECRYPGSSWHENPTRTLHSLGRSSEGPPPVGAGRSSHSGCRRDV